MGACVSLIKAIEVENEPIPVERPNLVLVPVLENSQSKAKIEQLENLDPNKVPKVPLQNEIIDARIVDIHDGDTVKVIVLFGDVPFYISIRLLGVDAPEIRKSKDKLIEEYEAAVKVRDYMRSMFPRNIAKVKFHDWDKYGGRILGDIFTSEGVNVSELLISEGWVRRYNGEKKKIWLLDELTAAPFA
jgi:micrococcal nuclease